jgi:hypothetical protein
VVPKPALAIPHSNPKPVQQAADSSSVETVTISNTMAADQQASTQLAEALIASDPVSSNTTQQEDPHQQACSSGSNSTSAVLPSSDIVCLKNTVKSTATFFTKVLDCFHSFMALELEFDVTIGYWS